MRRQEIHPYVRMAKVSGGKEEFVRNIVSSGCPSGVVASFRHNLIEFISM